MSESFPGRPDHKDFWDLAEVVRSLDAAADTTPEGNAFEAQMSRIADVGSVVYVAEQRALRIDQSMGRGNGDVTLGWLDGFIAGARFQAQRTQATLDEPPAT